MSDYDAGLLNDWGGGNVAWWHDYLRYEIGRANEYWATQMQANESEITRLRAELIEARKPNCLTCRNCKSCRFDSRMIAICRRHNIYEPVEPVRLYETPSTEQMT